MISVQCKGLKDTLKLSEMIAFQGNLKKRTDAEIDELGKSLKTEGLLMPFAIWPSNDGYKVLDGHGRIAALQKLAVTEPDILNQKFPVVVIDKPTEEEARKALLQITSSYGKITKKGAMEFVKSIPNYSAPSISKFVRYNNMSVTPKRVAKRTSIIRVSVPEDKVPTVKKMLQEAFGNIDYIKIL